MTCSSYLPENYKEYDKRAQEAGISILFEIGLDPGIDHIVTMKMVEEVRNENGKVTGLNSHCGGLVAPKDIDNPLSYKFTWSPEGALKALSDCQFLSEGKKKEISRENLLYSTTNLFVNNSLNLCYYPNRDSIKYRSKYQIKEVENLIRGTIRFKGYAEIVGAFIDLGFMDIKTPLNEPISTPAFIDN